MNWALALYSAVTWAAQPLLRRKLRHRALAEPVYGQQVEERFGRYSPPDLGRDGAGQWVWLHAVSLGETRAAAILVTALRARMPGMRLLLTHGTATGRTEGAKLLQAGDLQVWQPWDTRAAVERFVQQFRPAVGVLMETEVWPNLVAICRAHGVPLALANARLSDKSLGQALRLASLSMPVYQALAAVWAQTQADAQRLRALAAPVRGVLGNLKFDVQPDAAQLTQGAQWRRRSARPVVLLASSREGEETLFIEALRRLGPLALQVQWLIVPRHPQRFDEVEKLVLTHGLAVQRRSGLAQDDAVAAGTQVLLGDTMGEMFAYYAACDCAFVGGSLLPLGGQNLIEPAALGKPVLIGPHTFNFALVTAQAIAAGGASLVADADALMAQASVLLQNPAQLASMGQKALAFAAQHRGATPRTVAAIKPLLPA